MAILLHITYQNEWTLALENSQYVAPSLETEGFIHCSTFAQVVKTANLFFNGQDGLVILAIDEERLTAPVRYENPTYLDDPNAGQEFPHIYGPINTDAVVHVVELAAGRDGQFSLPSELEALRGG